MILKIKPFYIFIVHFLNPILKLIHALYLDVLIFPHPLPFSFHNSQINTACAYPHLFISPFQHVFYNQMYAYKEYWCFIVL